MPDNGSGDYSLPSSVFSIFPNTTILTSQVKPVFEDIAQSLTSRVNSNGTKPFTGRQKGVAGIEPTDFVIKSQLDTASSIGPLSMGLWNAATTYLKDERCERSGSIYYANITTINHPPEISPAQWTLALSPFSGGQLTATLRIAAPTLAGAGLILPEGSPPTIPENGSLWPAFSGIFYRVAGVTVRVMTNNDPSSWIQNMVCGETSAASALGWASFTGAASVIPFDNTAPLSTEGIAFVSVVHTIKAVTHSVKLTSSVAFACSAAQQITVAVFEGTTLRAVRTEFFPAGAHTILLESRPFVPASGAQTYTVRVGQENGANILYSNGGNGSALFGGTINSNINLIEFTP